MQVALNKNKTGNYAAGTDFYFGYCSNRPIIAN